MLINLLLKRKNVLHIIFYIPWNSNVGHSLHCVLYMPPWLTQLFFAIVFYRSPLVRWMNNKPSKKSEDDFGPNGVITTQFWRAFLALHSRSLCEFHFKPRNCSPDFNFFLFTCIHVIVIVLISLFFYFIEILISATVLLVQKRPSWRKTYFLYW